LNDVFGDRRLDLESVREPRARISSTQFAGRFEERRTRAALAAIVWETVARETFLLYCFVL
jgi:hypothetical protein